MNDYENYDDLDDAILLQVEDGITYSPLDSAVSADSPTHHQPPRSADSPSHKPPGSADSPSHQPPVLPDPGTGLASSIETSSHKAVLATSTEGGPG